MAIRIICAGSPTSHRRLTTNSRRTGTFAANTGSVYVFAFLIDHVSFRQHAFVQNAGHENASRLVSKEYDVLAVFHAAQAGTNVVARTASGWIVGQQLATGFTLVKVADGLRRAPGTKRIHADAHQVGFGRA